MNKKRFIAIGTAVVVIWLIFCYLTAPTIRHLPLTEREHFILNPGFGDSVNMFEVGRGTYELQLYYYHFGDLMETNGLFSPLYISGRREMVTFYSNLTTEGHINFAIRTLWLTVPSYLEIEVGTPAFSWASEPVERIGNLSGGHEYLLMTYHIGDGPIFTKEGIEMQDLGSQRIEDFSDVEHLVIITIQRINE